MKKIREGLDNVSLESGVSQTGDDKEEADGKEDVTEEKTDDGGECRNSSGSHSDVGYSSMNEQVGVIEPDTVTEDKGDEAVVVNDQTKTLERTRSYSIVKPPQERKISGEEDGEALEEVDETLVADEKTDRTNIQVGLLLCLILSSFVFILCHCFVRMFGRRRRRKVTRPRL